jgi:RNA polymerase sigma-70 factor (ECF subfamily)
VNVQNVQIDPASPKTPANASGPRPVPPRARNEQEDLDLIARVARGEADALRTLATRMAPRVERVSRALMGGSLDARDAALHALIELLRSHANFRGKLRLERWGDRVAAVSVMRFSRAVSRRNGADPELPPIDAGNDRAARTFEQYLGMLGETSRQILLLRHALGLGVAELAEVMQWSPQSARERLLAARREFRALVRRRESKPGLDSSSGISIGAQRWCTLRDREALGEPLLPEEVEEAALLEAKEPEVWAYVAQVRALELYFDTRVEARAPIDGELVDRAVEALEVSMPTSPNRALVDPHPYETRADSEHSNWIGVVAWAVSVALALASALALYWHRPESTRLEPAPIAREPAPPAALAPPPPPPKPTVESLPSARTASRGARLRHAGRTLLEGSVLGQGDTIEALDKAGCIEVEPAFEVCLAAGSALTLSTLQAGSRQLTVVRGRVVARGREQSGDATLTLRGDGVEASTSQGALAFERASDGSVVRVRALRGQVALSSAREQRSFDEGQGAQVRTVDGTVSIAAVAPPWLQRDWDVLATGLHAVAPLPVRPVKREPPKPEADEPAEE